MTVDRKFGARRAQAGSALLIAIFALLLISVVGIALLLSTGTDTALAGNYRTSTTAYYAAVAGLEEARGRLLFSNPNFLNQANVYPGLFGPRGAPTFHLTDVLYILNPAGGETVDPTNAASPYADLDYATEFGWPLSGANVQTTLSLFLLPGSPLQGPTYKWVRITPATEQSLGLHVSGGSGSYDSIHPLYYSATGLTPTPTGSATQALEIAALAVLPGGSKKLLQYVVASPSLASPAVGMNGFPSALTLAGTNVTFQGPGNSFFKINGQDQVSLSGCAGSNAYVDAIGYTGDQPGDSSQANILAGATPPSNYTGAPYLPGPPPGPSTQSIGDVSTGLPPNWQSVSGLDSIVQNITNNADVVIAGPADGNDISSQAAPSVTGQYAGPNPTPAPLPMTIVVNGDLNLTSWHHTGNGLLLVTGTLTYDPDASWEGVILVIGQGKFVSNKGGDGGIDGALFIAQTRDSSGNLLSTLGPALFSQTGGGHSGRGINYSSCLVQAAQSILPYKVLSFREIPQTN